MLQFLENLNIHIKELMSFIKQANQAEITCNLSMWDLWVVGFWGNAECQPNTKYYLHEPHYLVKWPNPSGSQTQSCHQYLQELSFRPENVSK